METDGGGDTHESAVESEQPEETHHTDVETGDSAEEPLVWVDISMNSDILFATNSVGGISYFMDSEQFGINYVPAGSFHNADVGLYHGCALGVDDLPVCWGAQQVGQADYGQADAPSIEFTSLAAGGCQTCALDAAGAITCWGYDDEADWLPPDSGVWMDVAAGEDGGCALSTDNAIKCWGEHPGSIPSGGRTWVDVDYTNEHACALSDDGETFCWGGRYYDTTEVPFGYRFSQIATGKEATCGLTTDSELVCWVSHEWTHNLGIEWNFPKTAEWQKVQVGYMVACALSFEGSILCWGDEVDRGLDNIPDADEM